MYNDFITVHGVYVSICTLLELFSYEPNMFNFDFLHFKKKKKKKNFLYSLPDVVSQCPENVKHSCDMINCTCPFQLLFTGGELTAF